MDPMILVRKQHLKLMRLTCATLGHIISGVSQTTATTHRDGPDGWTVLEVLCHLRDFDRFFRHRVEIMLAEDYPQLPAYDHVKLAVEQVYNRQDLYRVMAELEQSRQQSIDLFISLSPEQWERAGVHPERGHFTITDAVMQIGVHEADHIEQITRILRQAGGRV